MEEERQPFDELIFTLCFALASRGARARAPQIRRDRHRLGLTDYQPLAEYLLDHLRRANYRIEKGEYNPFGPGQYGGIEREQDVQPLSGGDQQAEPAA